MFERYTDRARRVITLTQHAQHDMRHSEADTGHLLIGLIGEGGGVAFQALTALGVTPESVREAVWNRHPDGDAAPAGHLKCSPRLRKALEMALREAMLRGDSFIATEHLLLGLIREGADVGALALAACASPSDVRAKVLELLDGDEKATMGPAPVLEPADGEIASKAFADYLRRSGLLSQIGEEQCAAMARVFMEGFACGAGNMEGKTRAAGLQAEAEKLRAEVERLRREHGSAI